jgi:hypothetical protein
MKPLIGSDYIGIIRLIDQVGYPVILNPLGNNHRVMYRISSAVSARTTIEAVLSTMPDVWVEVIPETPAPS